MIYLSSDLHLMHDREFVYGPRGFSSIWDMSRTLVDNINEVVGVDDELYILGDLMLNDNETALKLFKDIKCPNIHIVLGNHDTPARIKLYNECWNVVEVTYATMIKYGKYNLYLSHYPTMTGNLEKESLKQVIINCFGHTHQKTNFYNDIPYMYHVGVDSHDNYPVSIENAIEEMKAEYIKCIEML